MTDSYFRHEDSRVETSDVGAGTRVWAFAHVLPGARIGRDCNICDHVFIENDVVVGDRVTVKCGVQLWDGVRLEDDVFVGPNVTFTNDAFPRSRLRPKKFLRTTVREGASIGANATILPGLTIGRGSMVGAGSVVAHDVPPHAIVVGNPAYIRGYTDARRQTAPETVGSVVPSATASAVEGVRPIEFPVVEDLRGMLSFGQYGDRLPFLVRRYFLVFNVPSREVRGEHAHRELHQLLVCVQGACSVVAEDGTTRQEFLLDRPSFGLHVGPMVWAVQYKFSPDAVLLVLASDEYDPDDYIRDYDEWRELFDGA